jgi:hypothetical protein
VVAIVPWVPLIAVIFFLVWLGSRRKKSTATQLPASTAADAPGQSGG